MKKYISLFLLVILGASAVAGCSGDAGVTSVSEKDIEKRILYNKIHNSVKMEYINDYIPDDSSVFDAWPEWPEDREAVRLSLVEDMKIIKDCKDKGILIDRETAAEYAEEVYNLVYTDKTIEKYIPVYQKVFSQYGLTEEEYIVLDGEQSYYRYNRQNLSSYFGRKIYDRKSDKTYDEQFDAYVDSLAG